MKKLKIGVLTEIISGSSGARAPLEIAKHLADRGHVVTVYAYNYYEDKAMRKYLEANSVLVITFEKPRWGRYFAIPTIYKRLIKNKHNILYFSGTPPFFIAGLLTFTPLVRMYQGTQFDAYLESFLPGQKLYFYQIALNRILNFLIYMIDFISFRLSVAVVAISRYAAAEGKSLYRRQVFAVIYHGSNAFYSPVKYSTSPATINLISVSRLTPYKGFHLVIEALKKAHTNKRWRLTIVGSQPKKRYIEYLKKLDKKNIRIISNATDARLAKLYSNSKIYVTCDRYLYFGLPIMEAAHFGVPAIALDNAAASEVVIHGKTGLVANNQTTLSRYLKELIDEPELCQKLGNLAKKRAQEFSWVRCAEKWEAVLMHFSETSR